MGHRKTTLIFLLLCASACVPDLAFGVGDSGLDSSVDSNTEDTDKTTDAQFSDIFDSDDLGVDSQVDARSQDARIPDAASDASPSSCMPAAIPCLADDTPNLVNVNTAEDLDLVTAGGILQLKGKRLGRFRLKPFVTLHGCNGAEITGAVTFNGNAGTIEGFLVTGTIVANQTGNYIVRDNVFRGDFDPGGQLQANVRDGLLGGSVQITAERNRFEDGAVGLSASTAYHTMTREVTLLARNNYFVNVQRPVRLSEAGLVGKINATIEFNTLANFQEGITMFDMDNLPTIRANILAGGELGFRSDKAYVAPLNMGWDLVTVSNMAPVSGDLTIVPASFANSTSARLSPDSLAVDAAGSGGPPDDHDGCPRPLGGSADIGAFESY